MGACWFLSYGNGGITHLTYKYLGNNYTISTAPVRFMDVNGIFPIVCVILFLIFFLCTAVFRQKNGKSCKTNNETSKTSTKIDWFTRLIIKISGWTEPGSGNLLAGFVSQLSMEYPTPSGYKLGDMNYPRVMAHPQSYRFCMGWSSLASWEAHPSRETVS